MTNAFTIPEKSRVLEGNRNIFPKRVARVPQNFPHIALKNSSKYAPPAMLQARKPLP